MLMLLSCHALPCSPAHPYELQLHFILRSSSIRAPSSPRAFCLEKAKRSELLVSSIKECIWRQAVLRELNSHFRIVTMFEDCGNEILTFQKRTTQAIIMTMYAHYSRCSDFEMLICRSITYWAPHLSTTVAHCGFVVALIAPSASPLWVRWHRPTTLSRDYHEIMHALDFFSGAFPCIHGLRVPTKASVSAKACALHANESNASCANKSQQHTLTIEVTTNFHSSRFNN